MTNLALYWPPHAAIPPIFQLALLPLTFLQPLTLLDDPRVMLVCKVMHFVQSSLLYRSLSLKSTIVSSLFSRCSLLTYTKHNMVKPVTNRYKLNNNTNLTYEEKHKNHVVRKEHKIKATKKEERKVWQLMHIETRILGRKTNQLDSTIWRALSEKRDGSLGNLSFLNLSRFLLTLFSLFFLSLLLLFFLLLLYFFIFWTTAPSSVVTTPWQSARPTRFDLVFFSFLLSSLYFVWLCKCFFNAILFFFSSLLPTSARPQCLCPYCRHYLSLSYGSVGAPPLPFALGPFTRVIRSPFYLLFLSFIFLILSLS